MSTKRQPSTTPSAIPRLPYGSSRPLRTQSARSRSPRRWRALDEDVRRCLTRVFPYGVLYTIESEFILFVAVMHCSREPGYWKRRVPAP